MPDIRTTMYLEPRDTVRVWEARGELRPTVRWSEMMHQEHAAAFTVAKVAKLDLLRSIRNSLDTAIRDGQTFEQWKAYLLPQLQKHGWWGMVRDKKLTGTEAGVFVGDRRLRTIYRTNIRMSRSAGRWRRYQAEKRLFPYIRYRSDHPRRFPRKQHLGWHGLILPVDHVFWQTHWPPNGWGCNCKPEQLSARDMKREGLTVSKAPDISGGRIFYPAGGEPIEVPDGIDPGFSYNPGTAHLRAIANKALQSVEDAAIAGLDEAVEQTIGEIVADPAFEQFLGLPDIVFPIAWLGKRSRNNIGARSGVVRFSKATLEKQDGKRSMTAADYRNSGIIIAKPFIGFVEKNGSHLSYFGTGNDGNLWHVAVKTTADKSENYLVSMRRARPKDIDLKIRRDGSELLFDNRGEK